MEFDRDMQPELFASTDEYRFNILGLELVRDFLVATNGHVLIAIPVVVQPGDTDGMVSIDAIKHARAVARKLKLANVAIECLPDVFKFADGSTLPRFKRNGEFPPWRQVVPESPPRRTGVNAEYLAKAQKALNVKGLALSFEDETTPIRTEHQGAVVVIMPMRV